MTNLQGIKSSHIVQNQFEAKIEKPHFTIWTPIGRKSLDCKVTEMKASQNRKLKEVKVVDRESKLIKIPVNEKKSGNRMLEEIRNKS